MEILSWDIGLVNFREDNVFRPRLSSTAVLGICGPWIPVCRLFCSAGSIPDATCTEDLSKDPK